MYRIILFILLVKNLSAQTIPAERTVNWTVANNLVKPESTSSITLGIGVLHGDGKTPNDEILKAFFEFVDPAGTEILLRNGDFLFNEPIILPPGAILKGVNPHETRFLMDLKGAGDAIIIKGKKIDSLKSSIKESFIKDQNFIIVDDVSHWNAGQWFKLTIDDEDLVTSDWAFNSVGQICKISRISGDTIFMDESLRLNAELQDLPVITGIEPIQNVGIECMSIERLDNTSPQQTSNIYFENAVNCWVTGVQSANCNFGHITIASSSGIQVKRSYFYDAFEYGDGGRGYGVVLQFTSGECLIENNIFRHLRHSVLLQAGANGNVISYNYSYDPYWTSVPSDASGDMVLHGNYVFANLFEQNICQNIVIDNSHGPNGPFNTFFRNRAEKFGIFFSADNSPSQNIVGNEITNTTFPYSLVNYTIMGADHFLYGNINKNIVSPPNTLDLTKKSLFYQNKPVFLNEAQWAGIGNVNGLNINTIPAFDRWKAANPMENACSDSLILDIIDQKEDLKIACFPNPFGSDLTIVSESSFNNCLIFDVVGRLVFQKNNNSTSLSINTSYWNPGIYFVIIQDGRNNQRSLKVIKQ